MSKNYDVVGKPVWVFFKSKEQAEALTKSLNDFSGYYAQYILEWDGSGEYIVDPGYRYDHDGDIVYFATFKKKPE